jgi:hypothetical protein
MSITGFTCQPPGAATQSTWTASVSPRLVLATLSVHASRASMRVRESGRGAMLGSSTGGQRQRRVCESGKRDVVPCWAGIDCWAGSGTYALTASESPSWVWLGHRWARHAVDRRALARALLIRVVDSAACHIGFRGAFCSHCRGTAAGAACVCCW